MLKLRQIEVFRAVMITGSISGAAKLLFVSQPAVSRLLIHTEQRLGYPLFERIKGRLYPTVEAKALFKEVQVIYDGVQNINELAHQLAEKKMGSLNIAASPSVGHRLIPLCIAQFRREHPNVQVKFQMLTSVPLVLSILDGKNDLGVVTTAAHHPNLVSTVFGTIRMVCIFPLDHPLAFKTIISIKDLKEYDLISYRTSTPLGSLIEQIYQEENETRRISIEVDSTHDACSLVHAGLGVAIVDELSAFSQSSGHFLVRPILNKNTLALNILSSKYEPLSLLGKAFSDILKQVVEKNISFQGFFYDKSK